MMEKIENIRKNSAFTLAETLISMSILAFIIVMTTVATIKSGITQEQNLEVTTNTFYTNLSAAYQQIIMYNTKNGYYIYNIEDKNNDGIVDSTDLRDLFIATADGTATDCSEMGVDLNLDALVPNYIKNSKCGMFSSNIIAGFMLDKSCQSEIEAYEFRNGENVVTKTIDEACGYIIYGKKGTKGVLGYDVFTIALGKKNFKTKSN